MIRVLSLLGALALAACAQAQSDSGRHRPSPPPPLAGVAGPDSSAWHVGLNLGFASGGDLFRVRAGGTVPWDPEGGRSFGSAEFLVTLDEGFAYGATIQRDLGSWLKIDAGASFTRLPMTAAARVGETVRVYEYDDLSVAWFGLGLEARLTRGRSHPFVTAGGGLTIADGARADSYDQTVLAGRFGVGYQQTISTAMALRLEIVDTVQSLDFGDYRPPTSRVPYPEVEVINQGPQHILGLGAGLVAGF
jgi:hypothetical protein